MLKGLLELEIDRVPEIQDVFYENFLPKLLRAFEEQKRNDVILTAKQIALDLLQNAVKNYKSFPICRIL